jgi:hypothetical protein
MAHIPRTARRVAWRMGHPGVGVGFAAGAVLAAPHYVAPLPPPVVYAPPPAYYAPPPVADAP